MVTQKCLLYAKEQAIHDLVLDLRSNGGGIICAAVNTYESLFPEEYNTSVRSMASRVMVPSDFRKSNVTQKLKDLGMWKEFSERMDPLSGETFYNHSWYMYSMEYTRGGKKSRYIPKVFFPDECYLSLSLRQFVPDPVVYRFDRILAVTDGLCGSACSQFLSKLRLDGKVLSVVS